MLSNLIIFLKSLSPKTWKWIIGITLFLIYSLLIFDWGYRSKIVKITPPIVKTETKTDTLWIHDTTQLKPKVLVKTYIDTIFVRKPNSPTILAQSDTTNCYTIDGSTDDGRDIHAELCSREFKKTPPIDLQASLEVIKRFDIDKTKIVTQTQTVQVKPSIWRDIKIGSIGVSIGVVGGIIGWELLRR